MILSLLHHFFGCSTILILQQTKDKSEQRVSWSINLCATVKATTRKQLPKGFKRRRDPWVLGVPVVMTLYEDLYKN